MGVQSASEILNFWFEELSPKDHFVKNAELDSQIKRRFIKTHFSLSNVSIKDNWRNSADEILARIIVLDQFPRNIFRDTPHSFATDQLALTEAKYMVEQGMDKSIENDRVPFVYMPYMHSENMDDQQKCIELFEKSGHKRNHEFAVKHAAIIEKYGRFPHRNKVIGRTSTEEEVEYLSNPGAGF